MQPVEQCDRQPRAIERAIQRTNDQQAQLRDLLERLQDCVNRLQTGSDAERAIDSAKGNKVEALRVTVPELVALGQNLDIIDNHVGALLQLVNNIEEI